MESGNKDNNTTLQLRNIIGILLILYTQGYHKRKAFIATQGPLPDTSDDFWRMVWEQKCATVVMLTKEREGGRVKCHRYWPTTGASNFRQYQVILHAVNEYPDYILREFKIVDTKVTKYTRCVLRYAIM